MNIISLYTKLNSLPENLKKEVVDFLEFLVEKDKKDKKRKSPKFGSYKGFFKMMPDFDEPLDDFKEYM
jgi:hypothetical protein